MKIAVYRFPGRSTEDQLVAMASGLQKHGIEVEFFQDIPPEKIDAAVVWSWRVARKVQEYFAGPILVMERGYIGDRRKWTSLGWDGLNGRAKVTVIDDSSRFKSNFSDLLKPWRHRKGYALIIGQVVGDAAIAHVNIHDWYNEVGTELWKRGWISKFRQHPVEVERGVECPRVRFAETLSEGTLAEAIDGAGMVVTFNSNSGVEAVLAGCPVHTADEGAMVYALSCHDFNPIYPDRELHLHRMAWRQFEETELSSGFAWDVAKQSMPA